MKKINEIIPPKEIKKIVTFSEPVKDEAKVKQLYIDFVAAFPKISNEALMELSIIKFSTILKSYKT